MVEGTGVTLSLAAISFLLAWVSFEFHKSENFMIQNLAVLFLGFSLAMLEILVISAVEIAGSLGLAGLAGIAEGAVWIVTIVNVLYFFTMFIKAMWAMFALMWHYSLDYLSGKLKRGQL